MAMSSADKDATTSLDRDAFTSTLQLVGLRIAPQKCTEMQQRLQGHILHRPKVRPILPDPAAEPGKPTRLLLLAEGVTGTDLQGLPVELREYVLSEGAIPTMHELRLGYDVLSVEQVTARGPWVGDHALDGSSDALRCYVVSSQLAWMYPRPSSSAATSRTSI
jgi:hypothetical protein